MLGPYSTNHYFCPLATSPYDIVYTTSICHDFYQGERWRTGAARPAVWFGGDVSFDGDGLYHLLGHSWDGQIAAELIVRHHPKGLKSVVLSNTLTNTAEYRNSVRRMEQAMGDEVWLPIEKNEREKTTQDPNYIKAMRTFNEAHACRVKPFPQEILFSLIQKRGDGDKIWDAMYELSRS